MSRISDFKGGDIVNIGTKKDKYILIYNKTYLCKLIRLKDQRQLQFTRDMVCQESKG